MKIVYELERLSVYGGMQRIMVEKACWWADTLGYDVTLLVVYRDERQVAFPVSDRIRIVHLDLTRATRVFAPWAIDRAVRRLAPDILVTCHVWGALACRLRTHRAKVVYEAHVPRPAMHHQWAIGVAEMYADAVVTLTRGDAANYTRAKRVEVIPNFVDIIPTRNPDYHARRCIGVGRLSFEKDFSTMLRVWRDVCDVCAKTSTSDSSGRTIDNLSDWTLDIYGDGPDRVGLERQIAELGLEGKVVLHAPTRHIAECYAQSSLCLVTSRFEGFGLVMAEAMACGLPVVAFDCPYGPCDLVADGHNGRLIPMAETQTMVEAVVSLMASPELRQRMGKAGAALSASYSKDSVMGQWQSLFESLISS